MWRDPQVTDEAIVKINRTAGDPPTRDDPELLKLHTETALAKWGKSVTTTGSKPVVGIPTARQCHSPRVGHQRPVAGRPARVGQVLDLMAAAKMQGNLSKDSLHFQFDQLIGSKVFPEFADGRAHWMKLPTNSTTGTEFARGRSSPLSARGFE
jgi:hypothetical protein